MIVRLATITFLGCATSVALLVLIARLLGAM